MRNALWMTIHAVSALCGAALVALSVINLATGGDTLANLLYIVWGATFGLLSGRFFVKDARAVLATRAAARKGGQS